MSRLYRTWALLAVAAGMLGITLSIMLGGAFGTAAATGASPSASMLTTNGASASSIFGCRASVVRAVVAGAPLTEPAVANAPETPCADDSALVQSANLLGGSTLNVGTVGPAGAYTDETGSLGGADSPGATSAADVNALSLDLAGYTLSLAGPAEAQAAVECVGTALQDQYSSNLDALVITGPGLPAGGQTIDLGSGINQAVSGLPAALSLLVTITANNVITGPNSLTAQLLDVTLLASNVQIVIGEAAVSYSNASVCSANVPNTTTVTNTTTNTTTKTTTNNTTVTGPGTVSTITGANGTVTTVTTATVAVEPGGSVPTILEECAPGSLLDSSTGNCVIYDGGQTIFVSKPFQGPTGGTVEALAAARKRFTSPCLSGSGPRWVMLVTSINGHAKGTPSSDRILGLGAGEKISGLAGNDCVDAKGANAKVIDGNGKDRLYVTKGTNRVIAGNGSNQVHGGNGKDWITDGTGVDRIYGGKLANRIDAYGNKKYIYGGPANDRIWTNAVYAVVRCGGGTHNILFARRKAAAYGHVHGCQKISVLK